MKLPSLLLTLLTLVSFGSSLRADVVVVQHMEGPMTADLTMKIKGNKMRIEQGTFATVIMNFDTGETLTMVPSQKLVMKMTGEQMKKTVQAAQKTTGGVRPAFIATGHSEKINGYQADEYLIKLNGMEAHYWFSKDYPNAAAFRDMMVKMMESSFSKMAMAANATPEKFPEGVPVKTEMDAGGQKITTTLVSVTEAPVADSDFTVPAGYKEMAMPAMPQ